MKAKLNKSERPALQKKYYEIVVPSVKKQFDLKNNFEVPRIVRIVVNVGIGKIMADERLTKKVWEDIKKITGQSPVYALSKKAISGFKIKQGDKVGIKVTLRGKRMWEFLERLVVATLPRIKDFQGIPENNFGSSGNCSVGIKEQIVFPEINPDETDYVFGLEVCIVTNGNDKNKGIAVLKELGFPIRIENGK